MRWEKSERNDSNFHAATGAGFVPRIICGSVVFAGSFAIRGHLVVLFYRGRLKRSRALTRDMTTLRHQLLTVPNAIISLLKCWGSPRITLIGKRFRRENARWCKQVVLFPKQCEQDSAAVTIFSIFFSQATLSHSTCQSSSAEHARNDLSRRCLFRPTKRPPLALRLYWNTSACFIHTLRIPPEGQVSFRNEARHSSFFPGVFPLLPARALWHADLCLQPGIHGLIW